MLRKAVSQHAYIAQIKINVMLTCKISYCATRSKVKVTHSTWCNIAQVITYVYIHTSDLNIYHGQSLTSRLLNPCGRTTVKVIYWICPQSILVKSMYISYIHVHIHVKSQVFVYPKAIQLTLEDSRKKANCLSYPPIQGKWSLIGITMQVCLTMYLSLGTNMSIGILLLISTHNILSPRASSS